MTYFELTLYIRDKKKPLCTAIFESKTSLENFISSLSSESTLIRVGNMIFKKDDFHYAEIIEKTIKK